jgi:predicted RNase H-like HicB family nuclease
MKFEVYVETGPKHRKSMTHVLELPGTIASGDTLEQALDNTRAAILERVAFLRRHGEKPRDPEPIELVVAEEDTTTGFIGFAAATFAPDLEPISKAELERLLRQAEWAREDLLGAARAQRGGLRGGPPGKGRVATEILAHVAGAERAYLNSVVGPADGLNAAIKAIEANPDDPWDALAHARELLVARIRAMSEDERTGVFKRGKEQRTARRMMRRTLEHEWEHVLELRSRLPASNRVRV